MTHHFLIKCGAHSLLSRPVKWMWLVVACAISLGCNQHHMPRPNVDVYRPPSEVNSGTTMMVGAALRDVTPPAGASLAGHGPGGRVSMGHWTRLYCRAFYIEPKKSFLAERKSPVALVACELPYISTLLVRRTMEALDERRKNGDVCGDLAELDATRLMISAIHTHAGPAHYFDVPSLGGFASSQFPGYDDKMVDFLAKQIADAVIAAHQVRQQAELRWLHSNIFSFSRNSALRQFLLNVPRPDIPDCIDTRRGQLARCDQLGPEDLSIDPHLRLLEFRNADTKVMIGAIGFYALHPTIIGNRNRHYGSDIFGIVTRNMEQELRREVARECSGRADFETCSAPRPIFALFNTNEADAQARRVSGTETEVIHNGNLLTEAVWNTHCSGGEPSKLCRDDATLSFNRHGSRRIQEAATADVGAKFGASAPASTTSQSAAQDSVIVQEPDGTHWNSRPVINSRYVDVRLPRQTVASPSSKDQATMDKKGQLGVAATRGSLANPTAMQFLMPQTIETYNYKRKRRARQLQTPKRLMPLATGVAKTVPFAVLQLDRNFISFVPAEITLTVGQMINKAVLTSTGSKPQTSAATSLAPDAVIAGLANGYMNYVTTAHEYKLQAYHGASTIYGIQSARFLTYTFECLARHLTLDHEACIIPGVVGKATEFGYKTARERKRFWREKWDKKTQVAAELNKTSACKLENTDPPVLCFRWEDEGPHSVSLRDWLVRIQSKTDTETEFSPLIVDTTPFQGRRSERVPDSLARSYVDDRGSAFLTQVLFRKHKAWNWSTLFSPSTDVWEQMKERDYRIEINRGTGKAPLYSQSLREVAACTAKMINEYCTTDP